MDLPGHARVDRPRRELRIGGQGLDLPGRLGVGVRRLRRGRRRGRAEVEAADGVVRLRGDRGAGLAGALAAGDHRLFLEDHHAVAVAHLVDQPRLHPEAAVGEGGIAARDRQRRQRRGTQRHREVRRQAVLLETEVADVVARVLDADGVQHAHRDQVARAHQRLAQAHRADELAVVVLGAPDVAGAILEHHGRVHDHRRRVVALLERRGIQERLVAGARLALGLGGAVELAAGEAEAAVERAQRTGAGLHGDQRGLRGRDLGQPVPRGGVRLALAGFAFSVGVAVHADHVAALEQRPRAAVAPAVLAAQLHLAAAGQHHRGSAVPRFQHDGRDHVDLGGNAAQPRAGLLGALVLAQLELLLGAAPAVAAVVGHQPVAHGGVGGALHVGVDGGGDAVAARERLGTVALHHLLPDHLGDVGRVELDRRLVRAGMHRGRLGGGALGGADEAEHLHALKDVVAAHLGTGRVAERVGAGRELRRARQRGHLVQVQLVELLAVVELGRRGHAVGAVPEEAVVEVELEDLVLAQLALHAERQQHLGRLAGVAVLGAEEELAGDLLGDGRTAGHALVVGGQQQPHRPRHALEVHAVVLVEAGVLDRDEGLLEALGHLVDADRVPAHLAEDRDQRTVRGMDVHRLLQLDVAQRLHVGQAGGDAGVQHAGDDGARQHQHGEGQQGPAEDSAESGRHRAHPAGGWRPGSIE